MPFRFENLEVFKLALNYAETIYCVTKSFPSEEKFGMTANIRRAATSIAQNIAEGSGRGTSRDFMRFIDISLGSLFETVASMMLAQKLTYLPASDVQKIREEAQLLGRKLNSLKKSLAMDRPIHDS